MANRLRASARAAVASAAGALLTLAVFAGAPAVPAMAAPSGPVSTTTTANLGFQTSGQGMWGPGSPQGLGSANVNLFNPITWNQSASFDHVATVGIDSNADIDATNGGDTDGDAGNENDLSCSILNNDWNASIQEDGEINGSDNDGDASSDGQVCVDSNLDADYINVDTDGDANNQNDLTNTYWGANLSASTSGVLGLQMSLPGLSAGSLAVNYPVSVSQTVAAPGQYLKPGDQVTFSSAWAAQPGASISTSASQGSAGLNGVVGLSADVSGSVCVGACTNNTVIGLNVPQTTFPIMPAVGWGTPLSVSKDGITGTMEGPQFGVSQSTLTGNTLTATGSVPIWSLNASLEGLVQAETNTPLAASVSVGGANFSYNLVSGNANPSYSATQTLTFNPSLIETMNFSAPVAFTTYDAQGGVYGSGTASTFTYPAGGKAVVTVPQVSSGPLTYWTSFALAGSQDFTNKSAITGSFQANFSALSVYASFTNLGQFSAGPLYQTGYNTSYNLPLLGQNGAYNAPQNWNLQGFSPENGASGLLQVDSVPPVTTATLQGPQGNAGWYTGTVQVTLSATDLPNPGASGVAATYYSVDNGPLQTYTVPFDVAGDGTHTVQYYSADNAGNVESTQTLQVPIDETPPVTSASLSGTMGSGGWYKSGSPVQLTLTAQDNPNGSGVAATYYSVNGGTAQAYVGPVAFSDGTYSVAYWSTDVAGNQESQQTVNFKVDQTAPTTTAAVSGKAGNAGWYLGPVSVALSAQDNTGGSGVASTYYSVDGGALQPYSGAFSISADGTHTVQYFSTDLAGNTEPANTLQVKIDQTPPVSSAGVTGTMGTNNWFKSGLPVQLTIAAQDNPNGSGVAQTYYSVNGGSPQTYASPVTFQDGRYTVYYFSTDVAGNQEAAKVISFKVDQTPPVVTYTGNKGTYTIDQTVDISCSATDNLSGVASSTCANLDVPAYTLSLGEHTLTAQATDRAGNVGTGSTTFTVKVSYESLCNLTGQFEQKAGVAKALCAKLDAAAKAGSAKTADSILTAYQNELSAQSGKSITAAQVKILDGYVTDLENQ